MERWDPGWAHTVGQGQVNSKGAVVTACNMCENHVTPHPGEVCHANQEVVRPRVAPCCRSADRDILQPTSQQNPSMCRAGRHQVSTSLVGRLRRGQVVPRRCMEGATMVVQAAVVQQGQGGVEVTTH
jgi:hypothetical protein